MKNKKLLFAMMTIIAALFLAYQLSTAVANTGEVTETTITGEVIDVSCYLGNGDMGKGPDHKDCAIMCAKAGSALAILTANGEIYFPVSPMGKNNNEKLTDYAGDNVEVKGTVVTQSGLNGIKITSVKKVN